MGLFLCRLCGEQIHEVGVPCDPEKLEARINCLEGRAQVCERQCVIVRDFLERTLASVAAGDGLSGETVEVSSEWLRKLWEGVSSGKWENGPTADSFLSRLMAVHRVFRTANDLFRDRRGTAEEKLNALRNQCIETYRTLYKAEVEFDYTTSDVIDLLEGKK